MSADTALDQQERIALAAELLLGAGERLGWWEK